MSSKGTVSSKAVWKMLDDCAPGYTRRQTKHNWRITYGGKSYYTFPLGPHTKERGAGNYEVAAGHVRALARQLEIQGCAKGHFPALFK